MNRDFFLVVDSDLRWVFQVSADGKKFSKLPLSNARVPVQAEYDPVTSRVSFLLFLNFVYQTFTSMHDFCCHP